MFVLLSMKIALHTPLMYYIIIEKQTLYYQQPYGMKEDILL